MEEHDTTQTANRKEKTLFYNNYIMHMPIKKNNMNKNIEFYMRMRTDAIESDDKNIPSKYLQFFRKMRAKVNTNLLYQTLRISFILKKNSG